MITFCRLPNGLGMRYSPSRGRIEIDMMVMRRSLFWRRQTVALFIHELVHFWQWYFRYRHDSDAWNNSKVAQEIQADRIQDISLHLMGVYIR